MASFKKYAKEELQSSIDGLYDLVGQYRESSQFAEMLKFCARLRKLSPFNAFLVQQQCPDARFVLEAWEWKKRYNRTLKVNARPLIILWPFGPIRFVYEIGDTKSAYPNSIFDEYSNDEEEVSAILDQLAEPYKVRGKISDTTINNLMDNMLIHGIVVDTNMRAGAGYCANLGLADASDRQRVYVPVGKDEYVIAEAPFMISVNSNASKETAFANICHELAHLFCYHLPCPFASGWTVRRLNHAAEEFEAETTAWLVCERLNIVNPSEQYLASYLTYNRMIPKGVSPDRILHAANTILGMFNRQTAKEGLLYAFDQEFKKAYDKIARQGKANERVADPGMLQFEF